MGCTEEQRLFNDFLSEISDTSFWGFDLSQRDTSFVSPTSSATSSFSSGNEGSSTTRLDQDVDFLVDVCDSVQSTSSSGELFVANKRQRVR